MTSPDKKPSKRDIQRRASQTPNRSRTSLQDAEDDSVIGRMFWRSLGLIASVALIGWAIYALNRPEKQKFVEKKTQTALPQERKAATVGLALTAPTLMRAALRCTVAGPMPLTLARSAGLRKAPLALR